MYVVNPFFQGELLIDTEAVEVKEFREQQGGRMRLWLYPDIYNNIPKDRKFVLGCDIAAGTGASNSAITISCKDTMEDVGEWVCPNVTPDEFAIIVVAIAKKFNEAQIIWDAGGHGRIFGKKVKQMYGNIYYRTDEKKISSKFSQIPGYYFSKQNKLDTLGFLRAAIANDEYIVRSSQFIQEAREYIYILTSNSVEHARSGSTIDPTGARENHGDIVISKALAYKLLSYQSPEEQEDKRIPASCYASRREIWENRHQNKEW